MLLVTEWKEFRNPNLDESFFDGRNQYNIEKMNKKGFEYYQIGVN